MWERVRKQRIGIMDFVFGTCEHEDPEVGFHVHETRKM